jgi:hypothetical protein
MRVFEPSSDAIRGRALGNNLEPTAEYRASKADLSASARICFLEREIRSDPHHREHRFEMMWPGIGSCVVDTGVRGLLVAFHRVAGPIV